MRLSWESVQEELLGRVMEMSGTLKVKPEELSAKIELTPSYDGLGEYQGHAMYVDIIHSSPLSN